MFVFVVEQAQRSEVGSGAIRVYLQYHGIDDCSKACTYLTIKVSEKSISSAAVLIMTVTCEEVQVATR